VVWVPGPWEAESEIEHGAIPTWNLGPVTQRGMLPSTDFEVKLQKLIAFNYDHYNWSWLLDPSRPPMPLVLLRVPAPTKSQPAVDPERPRVPGLVIPAKRKMAPVLSWQPQLPKEVDLEYS